MKDNEQEQLKKLPKIDEVIRLLEKEDTDRNIPRNIAVEVCRSIVEDARKSILSTRGKKKERFTVPTVNDVAEQAKKRISDLLHAYSLRRVVNATGIVLHTNLGRAPLCEEALAGLIEVSKGYSNLEFDLREGKRGLRYDHVKEILCSISNAEDALVVNNNAAAVLLVLNSLSNGRESIVSRGELIEIGGEFRIPEVMEKSGAILREIGTTNRTHLYDYENAINDNTGMILKVHTSNFRIFGFTEEIELSSLVELGKKKGIPVMNDLGSGCFIELDKYGFEKEPTVQEALKNGADVVTFSGDKLLGGPQAGIILGKKNALEEIKRNPLNRALRIDKLTLASLEATLKLYLNPEKAIDHIRSLRAMIEPVASTERRAKSLLDTLGNRFYQNLTFSLRKGFSLAGGGSLPTQKIPTVLLVVHSDRMPANRLEQKLRSMEVPVIARISEDEVLFDLRTIDEAEFIFIEKALTNIEQG